MSAMGGTFHGQRLVDLFAGSGALGLEALSRGAEEVVFVERARSSLAVLRENVALLEAGDAAVVVPRDVFAFLDSPDPAHFDIALADPPYGSGDAQRLIRRFLEKPFAFELWVEHPWREELPVPPDARTRRYGDTAVTTVSAPS